MPSVRRIQKRSREWTDIHRAQLRRGADRSGQQFGLKYVIARQRYGAQDFGDIDQAEAAWHDLKAELLAGVTDPMSVWGYRRFERGELPRKAIN